MIPKKIHYCWFGRNPKPKLAEMCIASWRKYCPDYEIIEWNEDNFDVNGNGYTRYCYDNQKWAFLSDYVRLAVVAEHGGLYFDTDVELVQNPDALLKYEAFFGFENDKNIATGLGFGAQAGNPILNAMLAEYSKLQPDDQGNYPIIVCPVLNTKALMPFGLRLNGQRQSLENAEILSAEYLNPYDDPTGRLKITNHTVSIHWYGKSWMDKRTVLRSKLTKPFHRLFGNDCFDWLKRKTK